ncbi:hypothetical protein IE53DRAFT_390457 [Violaceomyces palustris]|uniref:Uncharacterized protein n=1 Tax=Violaceomyces palustris TaxID=1673888 RepID=A0ACD0NNN4_9BASI|nr:hypothetical protein IE53DRAFT_390457 [Violaceomyces palustris]
MLAVMFFFGFCSCSCPCSCQSRFPFIRFSHFAPAYRGSYLSPFLFPFSTPPSLRTPLTSIEAMGVPFFPSMILVSVVWPELSGRTNFEEQREKIGFRFPRS